MRKEKESVTAVTKGEALGNENATACRTDLSHSKGKRLIKQRLKKLARVLL